MKNRFYILLLAICFILPCSFLFTGCGGPKERVSYTKCEMEGINKMMFYAVEYNDEGTDIKEGYNNFYKFGEWYPGASGQIKVPDSQLWIIVSVDLEDSYDIGDFQFVINGEAQRMISLSGLAGFYADGDYAAEMTFVKGDIDISYAGETEPKTFDIIVQTIDNSGVLEDERCVDLRYQVFKNDELLEYESKTELTISEFVDLAENTIFSYHDLIKVRIYFKDKDKFFPSPEFINEFLPSNSNKEYNMDLGVDVTLGVADSLLNLWYNKFLDVSLDDMTKIKIDDIYIDPSDSIIKEDQEIENSELTVDQAYHSDSFKLKFKTSTLQRIALQDPDLEVAMNNVAETWDIEGVSYEPIVGEPGFEYVTLDFGDYRPHLNWNFDVFNLHVRCPIQEDGGLDLDSLEGINSLRLYADTDQEFYEFYGFYFMLESNDNLIGAYRTDHMLVYYSEGSDLKFSIGCPRQEHVGIFNYRLIITKADGSEEIITLVSNHEFIGNEGNYWYSPFWELDKDYEHVSLLTPRDEYGNMFYSYITIDDEYGDIASIRAEVYSIEQD